MAAPVPAARESLNLFAEAWSVFARRSGTGEVIEDPGLTIASANTAVRTLNAAFVTSPGVWTARAEAAREYFAARAIPGQLVVCEDWLDEAARTAIEATGCAPVTEMVGMAADALAPPSRELPELHFRRVGDEDTRFAIADMNSVAYGMPVESGRAAIGGETDWAGGNFGYIGYANRQPVTAAATVVLGGILYVGWVATLPSHRQRGYAEAVMRHSLAEAGRATGVTRTALHSMPAGCALYARMGYQPQRRFILFAWDRSG